MHAHECETLRRLSPITAHRRAAREAKVIGPAEQKAQELAGSEPRLGSSDAHTMSP